MQRDIRDSKLYKEVDDLYRKLWPTGKEYIDEAYSPNISPCGNEIIFTAQIEESLEGLPHTRLCKVTLATGEFTRLTFGPGSDRQARYSLDGRLIAFLSDRHRKNDFQLYLMNLDKGETRSTPMVMGWVEYLHWSPDGKRILLGVAGHGADRSSAQGATTSENITEALPHWLPEVETGDESCRWRRVWVYDLESNTTQPFSGADINVWEAVWFDNETIAAVASAGPDESLWYSAKLYTLVEHNKPVLVYAPDHQLGCLSASPSGRKLACVEAICSDRSIVAGNLILLERGSKFPITIETGDINITHTEWCSEDRLLLAGHRDFSTVICLYDTSAGNFYEIWSDTDITTSGRYAGVSGINDRGDCLIIGEGFTRPPEIAIINQGHYLQVKKFGECGNEYCADLLCSAEMVRWPAPDGLEIQGWLLKPHRQPPYPLVMEMHGGPVWHWRPHWLGKHLHVLMLLKQGYAVFMPNPRGSSGRGQNFIRHVLGDLGGADTYDYLSGIDHLVRQGIADPKRLGVTGKSYGGYMTAWLITQDTRFAAAVSVAPMANYVTEHLLSNISHFVSLFLKDSYTNPTGRYFERSPVMHAYKAQTPTLNICGALDRCTPPEEAAQFHRALMENGVDSVLVTYPKEGHGIENLPALIDFSTRLVSWFERYMSIK